MLKVLLSVFCILAQSFGPCQAWSLNNLVAGRKSLTSWIPFRKSHHSQDNSDHLRHVEIPVLFEDEQILAINKPQGVSHHDDEDGNMGILSLIRHQQAIGSFQETPRLYGVHRLDRVTSGILIFAKDPVTAQTLSRAFRDQLVAKYYVGLSSQKPSKKQGSVVGNMVRGRRKTWYLTRDRVGDNVASTRFFTAGLGQFMDRSIEPIPPRTLILFKPLTGKTHQLRVAAKSVGLPLLGDPVYSDSNQIFKKSTDETPPSSRTYLHSAAWHLPSSELNPSWTIWSSPPFDAWDEVGQQEFDGVLRDILHKRCDSDAILNEMERQEALSSTYYDQEL